MKMCIAGFTVTKLSFIVIIIIIMVMSFVEKMTPLAETNLRVLIFSILISEKKKKSRKTWERFHGFLIRLLILIWQDYK